jgi:acetolactate synthase-1/2/3 large subunit
MSTEGAAVSNSAVPKRDDAMPAAEADAATTTLADGTVAEAYLGLLAARGIDYLFANAGTDFAPLIEGFAKARSTGATMPTPITVPHENVAVAMALGHTLVSGRAQAVMVHVNVGTANAICGVLNASRLRVPMLFTAGRTPILEAGDPGARSGFIHWPQEMYDQAGMVREAVKWDYELRSPLQLETVVDRALSVASNAPAGPVYLTLPREVLAHPLPRFTFARRPRQAAAAPPAADPAAIAEAARLIARAERPLIVTTTLGRTPEAVEALATLAEEFALPVVPANPRFMELASDHPMHMGYEVGPWLKEADLVLVVESTVPWIPAREAPRADASIVHLGEAPLYEELPIRSFPCDLAITADPARGLRQLAEALRGHAGAAMKDAIGRRRAAAERAREEQQRAAAAALETARAAPAITSTLVSRLLDEMRAPDSLVFKESPLKLEQMRFTRPGTLFFAGAAGGLGWSLGAGLGAQLAAPDREVIVTVGDGAYMFGAPLAAHYVAAEQRLPVLFIVFNNRGWHAVRRATRGMYGDGYAARANVEPLTAFGPDMHFEKAIEVAGGYGERVEDPAELAAALGRCFDVVRRERRQALLNVMCLPG